MALDLVSVHRRCSPVTMETPPSPPDTDCPSPGSGSPGRCSSSCSPAPHSPHPHPALQRLGHPHPHPQANNIPITNFCIEEILKPSFGKNLGGKDNGSLSERYSAFSPWGRSEKGDHKPPMSHTNINPSMFSRGISSFGFPYDLSQQSRTVPLPLSPQWMSTSAAAAAAAASAAVRTVKSKAYSSPYSVHRDHLHHRDIHSAAMSPPVSPAQSISPIPTKDSTTTTTAAPRCPAPEQETKKTKKEVTKSEDKKDGDVLWPAWVYCTRYSDRPSSGRKPRSPRSRKIKQQERRSSSEEKRPRTAFTNDQLARLKREFDENRYLTEERRQRLSTELQLNESQIKIWFQNKRAKMKKASGHRNGLALQLMAQGLYNHSTIPVPEDDLDDDVHSAS